MSMATAEHYDVHAPTRRLPVEQMREALAELQTMRAAIDAQIDALKRLLEPVTHNGGSRSYPRKRDAVLALLGERAGEEMQLAQIRAHLIARGEIPNTAKAAHALQMTLSTLVREGHVERVRQGVYRVGVPGAGDRLREAVRPYQGALLDDRASADTGVQTR
jgi:hypothetical protein